MRLSDVEAIEGLIAKHQKTEARHIKEFTKMQDWIAVELDEGKMEAWKELLEKRRQKMVVEKHFIRELASLLGKEAPNNVITTSGLLHVLPTVVV